MSATPEQIAREAAEKLLHESDRIARETTTDEEAVDEGAKIILDAIRRIQQQVSRPLLEQAANELEKRGAVLLPQNIRKHLEETK